MDSKILIAYASKYGATMEIAEKIGERLRQAGLPAEVKAVGSVRDVGGCRAVILGSALYIGKWHKGAEAFLKQHESSLAQRPVWLFSSGPTGQGDPLELIDGQRLPAGVQALVGRIRPRDVTVFHGHIDLLKLNAVEKWAIKSLVKKPFGDFRDWEAIAAWADGIAGALKNSAPAQ